MGSSLTSLILLQNTMCYKTSMCYENIACYISIKYHAQQIHYEPQRYSVEKWLHTLVPRGPSTPSSGVGGSTPGSYEAHHMQRRGATNPEACLYRGTPTQHSHGSLVKKGATGLH